MNAGDALPELYIAAISAEAMKTMAVILDDPNEIHLDPDVVKALGLGDKVINQGPSNSGYVMNMLGEAFPGGRVTRFTARFLSNVVSDDAVTAGGRVDSVDDGVAVCSVWLRVEPDRLALEATAEVALAG
jgi:acyl dehydratase